MLLGTLLYSALVAAPRLLRFFNDLSTWATDQDDVVGVALVGSHARGAARPDSDVDLVILTDDPRRYLENTAWIKRFGDAGPPSHEDYKMVQSLRVIYGDGLEVEFGLTVPAWAATEPLNPGTRRVISDGCRIIFDRRGVLAALIDAVSESA